MAFTYGMQLPIQTLTLNLIDPWEESATVADLVAVAQKAEATGHSFIGVCDHVAVPDDDYAARMRTTWYDTVATLSYLAANTTRVRLLSTILVAAYRHPLLTASAFGTLDHLSGGRVILGMGAGHVQGEFEALGIPFADRGRIFDETLEALAHVWDDQYASFEGERFRYSKVGVDPRPASGRLPTWIGGMGKVAWRRVGRYGDGYIPMANKAEEYPEIISTIREAAEKAGRGDAPFEIGYMPGWAHLTGARADELPPTMNYGAEALAADIRAGLDAGATVIHLKFRGRTFPEYLEQLDAFAQEVVPLLN